MLSLAIAFGLGVLATALAAQPRKRKTIMATPDGPTYRGASWTAGSVGTMTATLGPEPK